MYKFNCNFLKKLFFFCIILYKEYQFHIINILFKIIYFANNIITILKIYFLYFLDSRSCVKSMGQ